MDGSIREGPLRDTGAILDLARAKFDASSHVMGLAARLLLVRDVRALPKMIRRVRLAEMVAFFEERARALVRTV